MEELGALEDKEQETVNLTRVFVEYDQYALHVGNYSAAATVIILGSTHRGRKRQVPCLDWLISNQQQRSQDALLRG